MSSLPPAAELLRRAQAGTQQQAQQRAMEQQRHFSFASVRINAAAVILQGLCKPGDTDDVKAACVDHALQLATELMDQSGLGFRCEQESSPD